MLGDAFLHQLPHAFGTILIVIYSFAYQKKILIVIIHL